MEEMTCLTGGLIGQSRKVTERDKIINDLKQCGIHQIQLMDAQSMFWKNCEINHIKIKLLCIIVNFTNFIDLNKFMLTKLLLE